MAVAEIAPELLKNAKIHQMDINIAFLYSSLEETIYIEQLEEFIVPGKEHFIRLL